VTGVQTCALPIWAFTGAIADKLGLIALAHQGTLFLDEIGDMPISLQAKLLKVIETSEVYPLGDTKSRLVDIRVIAATNVDIENRLKTGKFREDLYWRLNVIEIKIPPLRERKEDIEMLTNHFISKLAQEHDKNIKGIDRDALALLIDYSWPGNVRELKNTIERSIVLAEGPTLTAADLPEKMRKEETGKELPPLKAYLGDYEKNLLSQTYTIHNKNKEETARALGIDLATLYRKFKKYGIESE
jgi:transcriptional regulator with PAS, ATPase and Fis domain